MDRTLSEKLNKCLFAFNNSDTGMPITIFMHVGRQMVKEIT